MPGAHALPRRGAPAARSARRPGRLGRGVRGRGAGFADRRCPRLARRDMGTGLVDGALGFDASSLRAARGLYAEAGLGAREAAAIAAALASGGAVATDWDGHARIGLGRLISDGVHDAGASDLAAVPRVAGPRRRQGDHGSASRLRAASHAPVSHGRPRREDFYRRLGDGRHRTALAKYPDRR